MPADGQPRLKEVAYWYIDYREFANVTKYKLAMIHKGIEEATKHVRGFFFLVSHSRDRTLIAANRAEGVSLSAVRQDV